MATAYRIESPRWKRDTAMHAPMSRELPVDKVLVALVVGLTLFGTVMVYSASAVLAQKNYGNQYYFLLRQGAWAAIGLIAMAVALRIDYRHYKRPGFLIPILGVTSVLLVAVLFFPAVNGTHRWIRYGSYISIQPSEISKLALVAFLAFFLERKSDEIESFRRVFIPAAGVAGMTIVMVAAEPDLGTALALGAVFAVMMFHAGSPIRYLASMALPALPALVYMLIVPWRFKRLMVFLDPWKDQTGTGFQVVQSLIAIGSGGLSGTGFAQGKQKLFYLPAPHTDFIFAVIGEELGFIGAATVVMLFGLLAWRGFRAARFAPDLFGQLLAIGITVMIIVQALFNVSVALSLVPAKGIPLPFISSGGSSLAISLFATGVLLNVSKHAKAH
ncbi:MAG TPA: putative lipid II flippase FtsW [Blastocatellia bacterium]|nr:putative lipid II flippase FtsW [Blastocatellia bacterium]